MLQRRFAVLGMILSAWLVGVGEVTPRAAAQGEGKLKFEIYQDAAKDYRWRLKGADDKVLATAGQSFAAKADARKSVDRIVNNLAKQKFEVYEDKGKEYRWRLKASNGQVVAASSGAYESKADCEAAIESIKKGAPKAEVSELKSKEKVKEKSKK